MSADDVVNLYLANGYDGIVVTDHFLNGNTRIKQIIPDAGYEEKIDLFYTGYEAVRKAAKGRLKVFFGLEFSYKGTDILAYGFDKETLKACPELPEMDLRRFAGYCKEHGILAVQAHPFREASYIDHIRLYPDYEGVETYNAARNALCNELSAFYAKSYGKIATGGSDIHHTNQKILSGMAFDEEINSMEQLISAIRSGTGTIICVPNMYK